MRILSHMLLTFVNLIIVLQNEWLCLNCQTQRALSGQLGDMPPPPSPSKTPAKSQPTPPSSPARTVSSTPSTPAPTVTASPSKVLVRTPSVTQAPADKSEHDSVTADAKLVVESAAVKQDEESTQVVPEPNKEQTLDTACECTTLKSTTPKQTIRADIPPADITLRDIANAKETDDKQCGIIQQTEPKTQNKKGGGSEHEQHELEENDSPSNHANVIRVNHDICPSEAPILDNKPEIREDGLQMTKANLKDINEAKNGITKGEFVENEYTVEIKTENMSPPENPFVYSGRAEVENNKIEGKYFDQREEKQSKEESKVEQESIAEDKVHKSTQETQAPSVETPEYGSPAFPTPNEQIKSKLNTNHDILDEISHDTCLKTVDVTPGAFPLLAETGRNTHTRTEGANVGATENEGKGAEDLSQAQAIESFISSIAVEFTAGKDNKKTLQNELELEQVRGEEREHQNQANPTGVEELDTFSALNNISIIDNTKKEKVQQHDEVGDTVKLKTSNRNDDNRSQIDEVFAASEITVPKKEYLLSMSTQPVVEHSEETAPRTENVHDKQHSEIVEKSDIVEHNDIRSEMTSLTEAKKVQNVLNEKTVTSNIDSVKTESECKKNDSLYAAGDQESPESRKDSVPEDKKIRHTLDTASINALEEYTIQAVLSAHFLFPVPDKENEIASGEQKVNAGSQPNKEILNTQSNTHNVFCTLDPVEKPSPQCPVSSKQDKDSSSEEVQSPCPEERNQDGTKPFIKFKDIEKLGQVYVCGEKTSR